ncbi:MAG: putative signal transducing protein [Prolixibacteraceae bacterium]
MQTPEQTTQKWTTIITFNTSYEAQLAKTRLEADEIEVFLKDELSMQVQNHLNQAIGGIKLQVRENQLIKAVHILKSLDYNLDVNTPRPFWSAMDRYTVNIPMLKTLPVEIRFMILVAIVLILLSIPLYIWVMPAMM